MIGCIQIKANLSESLSYQYLRGKISDDSVDAPIDELGYLLIVIDRPCTNR